MYIIWILKFLFLIFSFHFSGFTDTNRNITQHSHCSTIIERAYSSTKSPVNVIASKQKKNQPFQQNKQVKTQCNTRVHSRRYNLRSRSNMFSHSFGRNDLLDIAKSSTIEEVLITANDKSIISNNQEADKTKHVEKLINKKVLKKDENNNAVVLPDELISKEDPIKAVMSECTNILENITSIVAAETNTLENEAAEKSVINEANFIFSLSNPVKLNNHSDSGNLTIDDEKDFAAEVRKNEENAEVQPLSPTY